MSVRQHGTSPQNSPWQPKRLSLLIALTLGGAALIAEHPHAQAARLTVTSPPVNALPRPYVNGRELNQFAKSGNVWWEIDRDNASRMIITQGADSLKAIGRFYSFDIGQDASVKVDQLAGSASQFLGLIDANGAPSRIFGRLESNGSVTLINQNGVVFGRTSQVNVRSLIASALDIREDKFLEGFDKGVNSPESLANPEPLKIFEWNSTRRNADGSAIDFDSTYVRVMPGARITTASGGSVLLLAPHVVNGGDIRTPKGQTILAGGAKVYLQFSEVASLRGMLVEVDPLSIQQNGTPTTVHGSVTNEVSGKITADEGNITLVGYTVKQHGTLTATTSVRQNGSIYLKAQDGAISPLPADATTEQPWKLQGATNPGHLEIGNGTDRAVTEVNPVVSADTSQDGQQNGQGFRDLQRSTIELGGGQIVFNNKSLIQAASGQLTISTVTERPNGNIVLSDTPATLDRWVVIQSGARIDVSGSRQVEVSVSRNFMQTTPFGDELKDTPPQRNNGFLYRQPLWIDVRRLPKVADFSKYLGQIERTASERSAGGGNIEISTRGQVFQQEGSSLDVSGGSIVYQSGLGRTTQLVSGGKHYDIGDAPANLPYNGFGRVFTLKLDKWNYTKTWGGSGGGKKLTSVERYYPGYLEGKDAGIIKIDAIGVALEGELAGHTSPGPNQRDAATLPKGGKFDLNLRVGAFPANNLQTLNVAFRNAITPLAGGLAPGTPLTGVTLATSHFSDGGFADVVVASTGGSVTLPEDVALSVQPGGKVELTAVQISVDGNITAPGGSIKLVTKVGSSAAPTTSPLYIGRRAVLSTRGLWTNDLSITGGNPFAPVFTKGGTVTLESYADLELADGSQVDVSGGGWVNGRGKLQGGVGGDISLKVGDNDAAESEQSRSKLLLNGELRGYGLAGGGSLTLDVAQARIGGAPPAAGDSRALLHLEEGFFQRGGFAKYTIKTRDGLRVAAGTAVRPLTEILRIDSDFRQRASGADLYEFTRREVPIPAERTPVELNLSAGYITAGDRIIGNIEFGKLVVEAGASIATDIGGKINLSAARQIIVDGTLEAPAGTISLSLNGVSSQQFYYDDQYIWLGSNSHLLAPGAVKTRLDAAGFDTGEVLAGGQISVTAKQGYIVTQERSSMDVSGTSGSVDIVTQGGARTATVETRQISSDAGGISLTAAEGMLLYGDWRAFAGGATARGGSLNVEMTTPVRSNVTGFPTGPRRIVVSNDVNPALLAGLTAGGPIEWLTDANSVNSVYNGRAFLALYKVSGDGVSTGGFDSLSLRASERIEFTESTSLSMRQRLLLDAPVIAARQNSQSLQNTVVNLSAPYLMFGNTPNAPGIDGHVGGASASTGTGEINEINLYGQLIDLVGDTALQNVGKFTATADGDIRLRGTSQRNSVTGFYENQGRLTVAGDITLTADQIYPTTLSKFTLRVPDPLPETPPGEPLPLWKVEILAGGGGSPVLSAGGHLVIDAPVIEQYGVLKAPFGEIDFLARSSLHLYSGSQTSVSGEGQLVPFGYTELDGSNLFYNFGTGAAGLRRQFGDGPGQIAPPQKVVKIRTPDFVMEQGAQVDVRGGGDLYTYEFTPGPPGRSIDILDLDARNLARSDASAVIRASAAEYDGSYAILPRLGSAFAPYDQQAYLAAGAPMPGSSVYLSGIPGLSAGTYALLPARYALLPGAFLVKQVSGYQDMSSRQRFAQPDGSVITSGYFTTVTDPGVTVRDARTSGFVVRTGDSLKRDADYGTRTLSDWIAKSGGAWQAPADAGRFVINATQHLELNGRFLGAPDATRQGLGSQVDILGTNIEIIADNAFNDNLPPDTIQIEASTLTDLGAASLLIGGERSNTASGVTVDVGATTVTVANHDSREPEVNNGITTIPSELRATEIMLVATDRVAINPGSVIRARGNARLSQAPLKLTVNNSSDLISGQSALLRVASGAQVGVQRAPDQVDGMDSGKVGNTRGRLDIGADAQIIAESNASDQSSVILDATEYMTFAGRLIIGSIHAPGGLGIGAPRISLGAVPAGTSDPGLILTSELLANLGELNTLDLRSYSGIDVYGGVQLAARTNLGLEAAQINGHNNLGTEASIRAGQDLRISNPNGVTDSTVATGTTGTLALTAGRDLTLGKGGVTASRDVKIGGFDNVTLSAGRDLAVDGKGSLTVAADLALNARRITGRTGADFDIIAQGPANVWRSVVTGAPATPWQGALPAITDVATRLKIAGSSITHGGVINLPSGVLQLNAHGTGTDVDGLNIKDIKILDGASIVAQGVVKQFDTQYVYAPGGAVTLSSAQGDVILENGASIDVSGAEGGDAGSITVQATNGEFNLKGELLGRATARTGQTTAPAGGSFTLDARSIANFTDTTGTIAGFTHLNRALEASGFNTRRHVRVRTGDLALGAAETITARDVRLVADGGGVNDGNIDIAGRIDARGPRGGHVELWADGELNVRTGAEIDASANGPGDQRGGSVLLATQGSAPTGINVESGVTIKVSGKAKVPGTDSQIDTDTGSVHVRAPRIISGGGAANNEVAITALSGTIIGARQIVVEAYQPYTPAAGETLDNAIAGQLTSATTFMNASAVAIVQRLQEQLVLGGNTAALHLRPGIEIVSDGNLQLVTDLNLLSSRYGVSSSEPGILTLRAAGNLTFNASLSDGFSTTTPTGVLQVGDSWSYRLVAGADTHSADANAVLLPTTLADGSGNFTMAANTLVRTGTGNIHVAAGGNVDLGSGAVVYTAGRPDETPLANFDVTRISAFRPSYPLGGGDLSIQAQGDIVSTRPTNAGVPYQQVVTDWLWRYGGYFTGTNQRYLTWYPRFDLFKQGVAAFGGGDVRVVAGGKIDNFSVALPTSGRLPDIASHNNSVPITPDLANLRVLGGGDMTVIAGGDILGGVYYLGAGTGKIQASGSLGSSFNVSRSSSGFNVAIPSQPLYTILALADGTLDVSAGGSLSVQTVMNPTVFPLVPDNIKASANSANVTPTLISNYHNYGVDSAVSLTALGGDVRLENNNTAIEASSSRFNAFVVAGGNIPSYLPNNFFSMVYPPTLHAASLAGDVVANPFTLYPSPRGQLELFAGGSVLIGQIRAHDIWPDDAPSLATLLKPSSLAGSIDPAFGAYPVGTVAHPVNAQGELLHAHDPEPIRIVALTGDVIGNPGSGIGFFPKPVALQAGRDLIDVGFYGQNLHDSDITRIQAGRDLLFTLKTNTNGSPESSVAGVFIGGPGRVEVIAGRDVDLGTSKGILTQGNINNPHLPEGGAALMVLAGSAAALDNYPTFNAFYLSGSCAGGASYLCDLRSYMRARTDDPDLSEADALAQFNSLRPDQQTAFVNHVLFSELRLAGRDATDAESDAFGSYQRGYDAITRLFPADAAGSAPRGGNISLYFSQLKTEQGGDIELLAPYGSVVAGLATAGGLDKGLQGSSDDAAYLGIVTVQGGAIRAMTRDDFLVNSQRVFTLQGGDIMLWSSEGDIDAGRGAKTSSAAPPPRLRRKSDGTVALDLTGSISGGGIAALRANPDVTPGDVDLIAPRGTVNAGDAGIRAFGDLNIAALQVLGADNISVGGRSAGLPVADTSGLGAASASAAAAGTSKSSDDVFKNTDSLAGGQLANVEVDVLGYGENPLQK